MKTIEKINIFLDKSSTIAIVGVSNDKKKFGRYLYEQLKQKGHKVIPINPKYSDIDDCKCYSSISDLPNEISKILITTAPKYTPQIVEEALEKGIKQIWIQKDSSTNDNFENQEVNIISHKCIMMYAQPVNGIHGIHRFFVKLSGSLEK